MNINKRKGTKWSLSINNILLILLLFNTNQLASKLFGGSQYVNAHMRQGNIAIPVTRNMVWKSHSSFGDKPLLLYPATKDKWVIKAIDGNTLDRNFDKWLLLDGHLTK